MIKAKYARHICARPTDLRVQCGDVVARLFEDGVQLVGFGRRLGHLTRVVSHVVGCMHQKAVMMLCVAMTAVRCMPGVFTASAMPAVSGARRAAHARACVCVRFHARACVRSCVGAHVCVRVCVRVHMHVHVCVKRAWLHVTGGRACV